MAPAASTLSPAAAAASKRPADSDAELLLQDSTALPQGGDSGSHHPAPKQQQQQPLECPRCRSTNTKFCYYNNYSTAQPRHFCRACRRYWTHGGTLRDVPVGGASRRGGPAKRRRTSASASPPPPDQQAATVQPGDDACLPDLAPAAFPFLSDGSFFLPQQLDFDLAAVAPAPAFSSWAPSVVPDFYDGLAPWDGATGGGAWGSDLAGLDLSWQPPAY